MARHLPSPPTLDGLASFKELTAYIDQQSASDAARSSPHDLLARAESLDKAAITAESRGSKKGILAAYLSFCYAFVNTRTNPRFTEAKKDPAFRARFNKLMPLYDSRRTAASQLKAALFPPEANARPTPTPPTAPAHRSSPSVDSEAGGSIAARLKALRGSGMDTQSSSKRFSPDVPTAPGGGLTRSPNELSPTLSSTSITLSPTSPPSAQTSTLGSASRHFYSASTSSALPPLPPSGPRPSSHQRGGSASSLPRPPSSQSVTSLANGSSNGDYGPEQANNNSHNLDASPQPSTTYLTPSSSSLRPHPLPPIPQAQKPEASPASSADDLSKFERAFPSVDNFGKQFDSDGFAIPVVPPLDKGPVKRAPLPDAPKQPPSSEDRHDDQPLPEVDFPSFPSLPSVPIDLPGQRRVSPGSERPPLPPPPTRPDKIDIVPSPPSPDLFVDLKRPASTPVTRDPLAESFSISPPDKVPAFDALGLDTTNSGPSADHDQLHASPQAATQPLADPPSPVPDSNNSRIAEFPSATPAAATPAIAAPAPPAASGGMPVLSKKPEFPFTNTITPDTLRSYFLNLAVDVLLLDVRPEAEFERGYVGYQYVGRGCKINVVWIDPTILMRDRLTSSALEDALSVSPEAQRLAFENRHRYDLCVIYDSRSTRMPKKGEPPTPAGRLFDIINEHEFVKPLPRFPALLIGGYEGWISFIMERQRQGMEEQRKLLEQQQARNATNGHASPAPDGGYGQAPTNHNRPGHVYKPSVSSNRYARDITENFNPGHPQSMAGSISSMPAFAQSSVSLPGVANPYAAANYYSSPAQPYANSPPRAAAAPTPPAVPPRGHGYSNSVSSYTSTQPGIAPLPRASIHPGAGTRRQSSYDNQQYSGAFNGPTRASIDYPQAHALAQVPQPPPAAASHSLDRIDARPHHARNSSLRVTDQQLIPNSGVRFWTNSKLGITGLKNLGNTCYMNSTIQCLSATFPFARFFLDGRYKRDINIYNNLGTRGDLAAAFAELLGALWGENYTFLSPITFRKSIIKFKSDFSGTEQHDSQEFLSFVMDGLHEDLNRIKVRPKAIEMTPEREAALETLPPQIASDKEWQIYKMRNDSFIVDLFQGQYMNRMECLTCHKTSTVYDSFQWLTLDLPASKAPVRLTELLDRWVRPEILDGDDKWYCPRCKVHRRASKTLTLVRLPPVLLIQLKRFLPVSGGRFWNKSETSVNFPLEGLDLTRYVPPRQPSGTEDMDDPRTQIGPFRYDLYGVSNHMGTLSSGHYTAYVRSGNGWIFCDDSRYTPARREDVMSRPGYILFYKRVQ